MSLASRYAALLTQRKCLYNRAFRKGCLRARDEQCTLRRYITCISNYKKANETGAICTQAPGYAHQSTREKKVHLILQRS